MARSVDSSEQQAPTRSRVQPVEREARVEHGEVVTPDVEALVQESLQSSFGNAIVQAALDGADVGGLGAVIAQEIAATTAGMGATGVEGVGLHAAGNDALMRAAATAQKSRLTEAAALNALRGGGGQHLPAGVRAQMELAFGRSFENVRIHTETGEAATALGAEAVAMGSHLHFAEGAYDPGSTAGKAVIAHELTHVIQAEEGRLPGLGGTSDVGMATEREAYANESLVSLPAIDVDSVGTDASVGMDAGVGSSMSGAGFASAGMGFAGVGMGPVQGLGAEGGFTTPMAAATSAPAMLRASDDIDKEESDTEASARHEVAMGLDQGFRRSIDMSQGQTTVNVAKEGTGRKDGVFTGPAKHGHLAVDEYNSVMRDIGPDGASKSSGADEFLVDSAQHTQTENDGHVHLDGDAKLGATPETTATGPGGDPVMGGAVGGMVSGADKAGLHGSLGGEQRSAPPGQSTSSGPLDNDLLNTALAGAFGKSLGGIDVKTDDAANKAIGAKAFTQNSTIALRSDTKADDLTDADAMETIGHEVAHALAGGGTSQNAVDQDGDKAEATADRAGKQFADYVTGGMRGPAPRLSPAVGGSAKRHRRTDDSNDDGMDTSTSTDFDGPSRGPGPSRSSSSVQAKPQGPELEHVSQTDTGKQTTAVGAGGISHERQWTEQTDAGTSETKLGGSLGPDGGSMTAGHNGMEMGVTVSKDTIGANMGVKGVSVNANITHSDQTVAKDDGTTLTETRTQRDGMSAGVATPFVGISGGEMTSQQTTIAATGDTAEARAARADQLEAASENGAVLDTLAGGEKVGTTTAETDSMSGFVGANGFSIGAGKAETVSTGITAERDASGALSIAYDAETISRTSGSLSYAGFGVGGEVREGSQHQVAVDVDESKLTDAGRAELESSLKSGVLPGAHGIETKEAQAASEAFRAAESRAADLESQLASITGQGRGPTAKRSEVRRQLERANGQMQEHRNTLNSEWQAANDAGAEVMPGVTVRTETEATSEGGGVSLNTPLGSANVHSEDDVASRTTALNDQGEVVETHALSTTTESVFSTDRQDVASYDSEGNVTLSTKRDVTRGSEEANRIHGLTGNLDSDLELGPRRSELTKRGTRHYGQVEYEGVEVSQRLSADTIQAAGDIQNAEEGASERFANAGARAASLYEASTTNTPQRRQNQSERLGRAIASGNEVDGVRFDQPQGMSADEVAGVYAGIEGPQDLAALKETHPENYTTLQSNFAKAAVAGGALESPEHVVGMLSAIDNPQARARTTAEVMHMLNERGDDAAVRMMSEFQRLSSSDPALQRAVSAGTSTRYDRPTAPARPSRTRRK